MGEGQRRGLRRRRRQHHALRRKRRRHHGRQPRHLAHGEGPVPEGHHRIHRFAADAGHARWIARRNWAQHSRPLTACAGKDASIDQLRAIPASAIIGQTQTRGGLRTVIDGRSKTQSIIDSFASGSAIDVPMIIGTNSDEGRLSGTQRVATYAMTGAPVFQYFFDYVPDVRRADNPNGAPHAAEIPFVFDTLNVDRRIAGKATAEDQQVADSSTPAGSPSRSNSPMPARSPAPGFDWPARTEANGQTVAIFQATPSLGKAPDLRSPPNGAAPGPTSRDED